MSSISDFKTDVSNHTLNLSFSKCGDISMACSIAVSIVYRSFFMGSQLDALENGHISAFLGIMVRSV